MTRPRLSLDPDAALMGRGSATGEWDGERFVNVRRKRGNPEAQIQRAVIDRLRFLNVLCIAIPNEGKRSAINGRAMKASGLRPGFPDLLCICPAGRVGFLEVKAPKGRMSPAQEEMHAMLRGRGCNVAVVRSQDEAVAAIEAWGW